jgi:hypothetical protein
MHAIALPGNVIPAVMLAIAMISPKYSVIAGGIGAFLLLKRVVSGRMIFEANRNYIRWLIRRRAETARVDPNALLREICWPLTINGVSPLYHLEAGMMTAPRSLVPVIRRLLGHPPEVAAYLLREVLPHMPAGALPVAVSSSALAADIMMALERTPLLAPELEGIAAEVLALSVMMLPDVATARITLRELGLASLGDRQMQKTHALAPSPSMNRAVAEALTRRSPVVARILRSTAG